MQPVLDSVRSSRRTGDRLAYDLDPYRASLEGEILEVGDDAGRAYVVLADTVFYPEGGGQPADLGSIDEWRVVDVQRVDGEIRHYLEPGSGSAPRLGPTRLELDWERRFDLMQQHTAQHLLTALALARFGWPTTSFHLYDQVSDIELGVTELGRDDLEALEAEVAREIRAARPVVAGWVSPETYGQLEVRSRRLPAGHSGDLRLVEIAGIDLNTCGGTHLRNTSEIESVKLLGTESCRGGKGTRLHWVAGGRVRRRLGDHEQRAAELRQLLGTRDDQLAVVAGLKLEQLKESERELKATRTRLARSLARELRLQAAGDELALVEAHFEGVDLGLLQQVARTLTAEGFGGVVFLTAEHHGDRSFVVAVGDAWPGDVIAGGREVAESLGARGGGRDRMFQGKTPSLKHRTDALERLARWARAESRA